MSHSSNNDKKKKPHRFILEIDGMETYVRSAPVDYTDKIKGAVNVDSEEMKKAFKGLKEIATKYKADLKPITTKNPFWTPPAGGTIKMLSTPSSSGGVHFPHHFSFTMKVRKDMSLSWQQRKRHEPHEIGINDLLAEYFRKLKDDTTVNWHQMPADTDKYQMTQGRYGHLGPSTMSSQSLVDNKKYWLDRAIEERLALYRPNLFTDKGKLIKFLDAANFYIESDWPVVRKGVIVKNDDRVFDDKLLNQAKTTQRFLHEGDTAMILKDEVLSVRVITHEDEWSGKVQFYRQLDVLLTRHGDERFSHVNQKAEPGSRGGPLGEPVTVRAKLLLNPSKSETSHKLFTVLDGPEDEEEAGIRETPVEFVEFKVGLDC